MFEGLGVMRYTTTRNLSTGKLLSFLSYDKIVANKKVGDTFEYRGSTYKIIKK